MMRIEIISSTGEEQEEQEEEEGREVGGSGANFDVASITLKNTLKANITWRKTK